MKIGWPLVSSPLWSLLPSVFRAYLICCAGIALPSAAAPFAYITNQGSHDVSVIDLATQAVVATVPVGRSPAGVVASSLAGRVYVSNPDSKTISVIDMRSQTVVDTLPAGDGPVGVDVSADGTQLLVADWFSQKLLVYALNPLNPQVPSTNTKAPTPYTSIPVGRKPAGVAVQELPSGAKLAWVAERDDDSVAVVDLAQAKVRARVKVGSHPFAVLLDAARQRLYVLNVQSDDVSVVDTRDPDHPQVLATVKVGKAPYGAALAARGSLLYVTNQHEDSVSVIDANSLRVLRTLTGFAYPEGIAAEGEQVYVVNWMDDNVAVLDAASGRPLHTISTGRNSRGFGAFIGAPMPQLQTRLQTPSTRAGK
jgi:YVTN family beta-propeller protein